MKSQYKWSTLDFFALYSALLLRDEAKHVICHSERRRSVCDDESKNPEGVSVSMQQQGVRTSVSR